MQFMQFLNNQCKDGLEPVSSVMVNFPIDDVFLLANCIFKHFKLRNLIKTEKMVQEFLMDNCKKYFYCPKEIEHFTIGIGKLDRWSW